MGPPMDHPARSSETILEVQELVHLEASSGDFGDTPLRSSPQTYLLTDKDQNEEGWPTSHSQSHSRWKRPLRSSEWSQHPPWAGACQLQAMFLALVACTSQQQDSLPGAGTPRRSKPRVGAGTLQGPARSRLEGHSG